MSRNLARCQRSACGLLTLALVCLASAPAFAQQPRVLLDDSKALVTQIELAPGEVYTLPKEQSGSLWIALDPVILKTAKDGLQSTKPIHAGEAASISPSEELEFSVDGNPHARLMIVKPKAAHQELTIDSFALESLEDGSDSQYHSFCRSIGQPLSRYLEYQ